MKSFRRRADVYNAAVRLSICRPPPGVRVTEIAPPAGWMSAGPPGMKPSAPPIQAWTAAAGICGNAPPDIQNEGWFGALKRLNICGQCFIKASNVREL